MCVCRRACSSGGSGQDATHHLDVADLLKQYGKAPGVLDHRALEQACTAIMACQVRLLFVLPLCRFLQYCSSLKMHYAESCSCRQTASQQPCSCWAEGGCMLLLLFQDLTGCTPLRKQSCHVFLVMPLSAVQLDNSCNLHLDAATNTADSGTPVTGTFRLIAALALFLEGLAGVYIPVLLRSVEGYEWCAIVLRCAALWSPAALLTCAHGSVACRSRSSRLVSINSAGRQVMPLLHLLA